MSYPKVELHCHMDGAIPNRLFVKYCREDGLLTPEISDEEWIANFIGLTNADGVDTIANATYSSKGAIEAVNKACAAYARL